MDGHPEALIDLGAIKDNVSALARHVGGAQVMAVVKSDGYGHGMIPAAAAALAGGATWLGVVHVAEAVALRRAGVTGPVLCLLAAPDAPHEEAIRHDVDLSAGSADLVRQIAAAAGRAGHPARLHLKADTGMSRGGATAADWPGLVEAALAAQAAGQARITGIWSHLACADIPGHPSTGAQLAAFLDALEVAERAGGRPDLRAGHAPRRRARLAAARDDGQDDAGPGQAGSAGRGSVLRAPLRHRRRHHARAGAAWLRRGDSPPGHEHGSGAGARPAVDDLRHGVHEPARGRLRG